TLRFHPLRRAFETAVVNLRSRESSVPATSFAERYDPSLPRRMPSGRSGRTRRVMTAQLFSIWFQFMERLLCFLLPDASQCSWLAVRNTIGKGGPQGQALQTA